MKIEFRSATRGIAVVAGVGIVSLMAWGLVNAAFLRSDMESDVERYREAAVSMERLLLDLQARPVERLIAQAADSGMVKSDSSFIYGTLLVRVDRARLRVVDVEW